MARKFLTPIDLQANELKNAKIHTGTAAPTEVTAVIGQIHYRSDEKTLKVYDGSAWQPVGNVSFGAGAPSSTPVATGQLYFDTTGDVLYASDGTASSANWKVVISAASSATALSNPASAGASATGTAGTSISYARADHTHAHGGSDHNNIRLSDLSNTLATNVDFSGSGYTIRVTTPSAATDAVNKTYVDSIATGINAHDAVSYATTGALGTTGNLTGTGVATAYDNGTLGVGATLTISTTANWSTITIDGQTLVVSDRILIKDQANADQNGIYTVTQVGTTSNTTSFIFTRATDYDSIGEVSAGDFAYILAGTTNGKFTYVQTSKPTAISGIGTSANAINFSVLSNGNISGTVNVNQGGTGQTSFTANGVILGNGTSALNVTSAGSAFNVLRVPAAGGAPAFGAISLTSAAAVTGTLAAGNGGTGQSSYAVGDLLYADTTSSLAKLADVATGNALISGGVNTAPSWGKIGLTTHISGTLAIGNGGTGVTSTPANGALLIGNGSGYTVATITAGTAIGITNGAGSITITNSGVTQLNGTTNQINVSATTGTITASLPQNIHTTATPQFTALGLGTTAPAAGLTVSGGKSTLAASVTGYASLNIATGTAPTTPASGDIWVASDLINYRTSGAATKVVAFTDSNITGNAANVTGTVAVANGGTGATTAAGAKTNLGFVTRFAADIGNASYTSTTVTHSLNSLDVTVQVYDKATGETVETDVVRTSVNAVILSFATAPSLNAYRVVVVG